MAKDGANLFIFGTTNFVELTHDIGRPHEFFLNF